MNTILALSKIFTYCAAGLMFIAAAIGIYFIVQNYKKCDKECDKWDDE